MMEFQNTTVFFIPVWFDSFATFTSRMNESGRWQQIPSAELSVNYLLNYASAISENRKEFISYSLNDVESLDVCMFEEKLNLKSAPKIEQVRFSCFGTGVGFMEFWVRYPDEMTPYDIADFSYYFKKATKASSEKEHSLYTEARQLLPEGSDAQLFFTTAADFKKECLCYHMICLEKDRYTDDEVSGMLYLLRRSYNTKFNTEHAEDGEYDMTYGVYDYDLWAGSQEGLVNIVRLTGNSQTDFFIRTYKYSHLTVDYYFLYLLLLNQRFSSVQYIAEIAKADLMKTSQLEKLNRRIIRLKTAYSFNVISDDQFFQNVYSKMYRILDIDRLLEDIRDNEEQMEMLQNQSSVKSERMASRILFVISFLSLFSALIDAAGYFDRWPLTDEISTPLSFICVLLIAVISVVWVYLSKNK